MTWARQKGQWDLDNPPWKQNDRAMRQSASWL